MTNRSYPSRAGTAGNISKRPLFRRMERWLVGVLMATIAYVVEKAVVHSIGRRQGLPKQTGERTIANDSGTI